MDDLKSGKEFEFEFSVNYEMEMKESKKDIEVVFFTSLIIPPWLKDGLGL